MNKKNIKRILARERLVLILILLFGTCMFVLPHAMAQQAVPKSCDIRKVFGRVSMHDWVASLLVVDSGVDELSLVVSRETTFTKRGRKITFSEINQSDTVIVEYYDCGFVGLKAITVTVTS
jgi:hypothetical protein